MNKILINWAKSMVMRGYKVVFISLEMKDIKTQNVRFDSRP